jgi:uncharacterized membrane protein YraQ (UPF0718 family)
VGVTGSVLTHHVKQLVSAGLVEQRRDGRRILCSVVITEVEALSSFLISECCADRGATHIQGTRPMADLTQNPRPDCRPGRASTRCADRRPDPADARDLRPARRGPDHEEMLEHFWGTLPFILFAVVAIAWMKASGSERLLDGAFKGRETRMILIGALVGGLSPFCSCQVIPFVAALLAAGAPLSAVMAFWLSSPLMDPAMFAITAGGLGFDFAVAKTVAAVLLGLGRLHGQAHGRQPRLRRSAAADIRTGGCCGAKKLSLNWQFWHEADRRRIFGDSGWSNLLFLGKWLMLAYLLQALLIRYVPAELCHRHRRRRDGPVLLAALVGAPAYLNGYAAVPLLEGCSDRA